MNGGDSRITMRRVISLSLILMVGVLFSGLVFGEFQPGTKRVVTAGEDLDIKGVILSRDGETFVLRDLTKTDTVVLLTDSTTIKSAKKGLFRGGKEFDVTALVPGLILTVKGKGDTEGRLMADKITFKDSDYKAAVTAFAMTDPDRRQGGPGPPGRREGRPADLGPRRLRRREGRDGVFRREQGRSLAERARPPSTNSLRRRPPPRTTRSKCRASRILPETSTRTSN